MEELFGSFTTTQDMQWDHSSVLNFDGNSSSLMINERGSQPNWSAASSTANLQDLFSTPTSPQRALTHTDVTLTRAECLMECRAVTVTQWLCWEGDSHSARVWNFQNRSKGVKADPSHSVQCKTTYAAGGSIGNNDAP